jgi:hypothetical protein
MPRGLNRCMYVVGLSDSWLWTGTTWMMAVFCTECMSCMCAMVCHDPAQIHASCRTGGSAQCFVWTTSICYNCKQSDVTDCSQDILPFPLTLWCLSTTLNITSNLNMSAPLNLGDAWKLGCRNWLVYAQDRGHWWHSYSHAFIRPRNKINFISIVLNTFLRN